MSVILFYSPFDQRSRDTESLMIAFRKQGHRVISLSQASGAQIHEYLQQHDVETHTHIVRGKKSSWYYLRHVAFLISFIRRNNVNVVYSHLEPANLVASLAQYFVKARIYLVRHHIDEAHLQGFNRSWTYRLTYALAKKIIVVSAQAKKFMIDVEKVDPRKIIHINLAYDFSIFHKPDPTKVAAIRSGFDDCITLLAVCRFTKPKRPDVAIRTLKRLIEKGAKARLILLGRGEEEDNIKALIRDLDLVHAVLMPGYVSNIPDYMAASDFLIHPSLLESSCVSVKEAALAGLPVIVCRSIGDFDDYMENEKNGFVVEPENFVGVAAEIVSVNKKKDLSTMITSLRAKIVVTFDIKNIIAKYKNLNQA